MASIYESRPWLASYPKGIPANIDEYRLPNVTSYLDEVFAKYGSKPSFVCMGRTLTYSEIDQKSKQLATFFQSRGLKPGDKVAIMLPSILQYPIAIFGIFRAGLVCVNTNPLYTEHEMLHQLTDSQTKGIVILENFAHKLEKIIDQTDIQVVVTTSMGELLGGLKGMIVDAAVRHIKKMVPKFEIENAVTFTQALKLSKSYKLVHHESGPDDVIALQYTGGTTGVSKGAMLTNKNLFANMEQIKAWFVPYLQEGNEVCLSPLPMYHIFAFSVNLMALFGLNTLSILIPNPRDLSSIVKAFKRYDITLMSGVNTLFNALLNDKEFCALDFKLKTSVAGGMALQTHVAEQWRELTGSPIAEGYGLTETSPVASVNPLDDKGQLGTIGLPVPSTELKIINEAGMEAPQGERGEICIRGPQVMKGYYNRPLETSQCLTADGWLLTGDIGIMEASGFFRIVDRMKDMILVSGFNVYPNEIEDVIAKHPKVSEVGAVGVPDPKSTEAVKVFVVRKDKSLTEKELRLHCDEYLTGYKKPKYYEFVEELPKTPIGKILRRNLRDKEENKRNA